MRIGVDGHIYISEKELFALAAKVGDEYSAKGMLGLLDERDGKHKHTGLFVESDKDHAQITKNACGISYVPPEIHRDHVKLADEIKSLAKG